MPHHFELMKDAGDAADRPWVWDQHWQDVLFLHWQVPVSALRRQIAALTTSRPALK